MVIVVVVTEYNFYFGIWIFFLQGHYLVFSSAIEFKNPIIIALRDFRTQHLNSPLVTNGLNKQLGRG